MRQSSTLSAVATRLAAAPLAEHSSDPRHLLVAHLKEGPAAAENVVSDDVVKEFDGVAAVAA